MLNWNAPKKSPQIDIGTTGFSYANQMRALNVLLQPIFIQLNSILLVSTTQHEVLENVSSHKDLGVYISNDLKWGFHVTSKLCTARQCFFSLKVKIPFNTPSHVKLHLYRSLVLSVLLYGFPAWYPDVSKLKKLENFKRFCFLWIF